MVRRASPQVLEAQQHGQSAFQLAVQVSLVAGQPRQLVGGAAYLLAPVTDPVLDALATVGAATEDMEPETTESDGDDEDYAAAV